jgi:DNA-binding GntR family transcriptional regulator
VRQGLEPVVGRMIGARRSRPDFTHLRRIVDEERRGHEQHNASVIELSGDFHLVLADLAGNKLLTSYMQQLVTRTILVLALYSSRHICLVDDHAEVLDALERGDTTTAAECMARHLHSIEDSCVLRDSDDEAMDLRTIFKPALQRPNGALTG